MLPPTDPEVVPPATREMTPREIDQFLCCARVGRLGLIWGENPYVVPVGFGYADGKVFFHTCRSGVKMDILRTNPRVCFEVDESISDGSLAKSVIIFGRAELIGDREKMIPYLQSLINKYRVPVTFEQYMSRGNRNTEAELEAVHICLITPEKISGIKVIRTNGNF
jgi:uncharacterized protein